MKLSLSAEMREGIQQGLLAGAALLVLTMPPPRIGLGPAAPLHAVQPAGPSEAVANVPVAIERKLDLAGERTSADVRTVGQWVVDSADNGNRSFVILDKKQARVYLFGPGGKLRATAPVLLGYAVGDDSVAGIGERAIAEVRPSERTTPAGRFLAEPGRNARNEDVVWVDYDAAVSMHRVITSNPAEHRLERLSAPEASARRISYGCINLPVAFFENVIWPAFREGGGLVYVLPEVKTLAAVFPQLAHPGVRPPAGADGIGRTGIAISAGA